MLSRLLRISYKSFVPRIFLNVVWASSLREFFWSFLSILTLTSYWNERPRHWPHWWWRCWPCSTPPRPHSRWRCPWSTPDMTWVFCSAALLSTSWGGTPSVIVLKSTFWYDSMQGRTKNIPDIENGCLVRKVGGIPTSRHCIVLHCYCVTVGVQLELLLILFVSDNLRRVCKYHTLCVVLPFAGQ